jgi:hypothetical protein
VNKLVARASVAPKTVTKVSKDEVKAQRNKRKRPTRSRSGKVTSTVIHLAVWKRAMEIAKRDRARIEVIANDCVIVHNNREWKG